MFFMDHCSKFSNSRRSVALHTHLPLERNGCRPPICQRCLASQPHQPFAGKPAFHSAICTPTPAPGLGSASSYPTLREDLRDCPRSLPGLLDTSFTTTRAILSTTRAARDKL